MALLGQELQDVVQEIRIGVVGHVWFGVGCVCDTPAAKPAWPALDQFFPRAEQDSKSDGCRASSSSLDCLVVDVVCIFIFSRDRLSQSLPGECRLESGGSDTLGRPWFSLPVLAVDGSS